jgi:DNA-binding response OmpR family regulator
MQPLSDLSIVLLEDEYLIALDAEDILQSLGFRDIKVVNTLAAAAEIAQRGSADLAILDLNINGEMSLGVAHMFREQGVPIVFASGYELRNRLTPELESGGVYLRKPYTLESLKRAIQAALEQAAARSGADLGIRPAVLSGSEAAQNSNAGDRRS